MLVLRDLKARTKQAYLGYFWILIQPLLLTGAFSFLVQQVLGSEAICRRYPVPGVRDGGRHSLAVLRQ